LQSVSQTWLERKGGKYATEMGFSMGRFDELVEAAGRANLVAEAYSPQGNGFPKEVPRYAFQTAHSTYTIALSLPQLVEAGQGQSLLR
jgi:hypothetical protein